MPVVTVGGEKKKVACGPCIRGHRSSKCAHKDRVLIEVRKPGRPLGSCPHPTGSCGCERVVINYMIPKGKPPSILIRIHDADPSREDRAASSLPQGLSPASAASSRVQKSTTTSRSVANLPQSTVDKVLSGDTSALAVLAQFPSEPISSSDSSSLPPSASSSASATPRIDAIQSGSDLKSISHVEDNTTTSDAQFDNPPPQQIFAAKSEQHSSASTADLPSQSKSCCCSSQNANISAHSATPLQRAAPIPSDVDISPQTNAHHAVFSEFISPTEQLAHEAMDYDFSSADFPSFEFAIGCGGMQPPVSSISERIMASETVHCDCGDSCQCFACMTHPRNRTTVDYVRYHNELLSQASYPSTTYSLPAMLQDQRPTYDTAHHFSLQAPSISPRPLESQIIPQSPHSAFLPSHDVQWAIAQSQISATNIIPHTPVSELQNLHFPLYSSILSPSLVSSESHNMSTHSFINANSNNAAHAASSSDFNSQTTPQKSLRKISNAGAFFDADSPHEEDGSTLSPSSFLLQQFTVPGCDDLTGTCQCGEGCSCPGCLTHSGHARIDSKPVDQLPGSTIQNYVEVKTEKKSCCS